MCQLVDYSVKFGDDLVDKFKIDSEFRIAVSVDMMDTGVDVPSVLNLVFFKKVRSKIKFIQMIGRGTRLCKDVYGPGKDKSSFLIFDYCGNFEFFNIHPDGYEVKEQITLSQRLFQIRLDMLFELQKLEYQQDTWLHAYYEQIKTELHNEIVRIKANSSRVQVRYAMNFVDKYYDLKTWDSLSPVMVKEAKNNLSCLVDSGLGGEYLTVAFDLRMYFVEHNLLAEQNKAGEHIKRLRTIAKYLLEEKASIPQVLAKANDLQLMKSEGFWSAASVQELERMRTSVRDLMQFLKGSGPEHTTIDIHDLITDADFQPGPTTVDIRTYREKVIDYLAEHSDSEVIRKIRNLKPLNSRDFDELEQILWHELGTEEDYRKETEIGNLAAFVRSLVGLNQEAVNERFGAYLTGNMLNAQQQEFIRTIINYVRENGDIETADMVNTEPFNNYNITEMFGAYWTTLVNVINILHGSIVAA